MDLLDLLDRMLQGDEDVKRIYNELVTEEIDKQILKELHSTAPTVRMQHKQSEGDTLLPNEDG